MTKEIYKLTQDISKNYSKYRFKYFTDPADEPILALSMAVNHQKPIEVSTKDNGRMFCFYPASKRVCMDMREKQLNYLDNNKQWNYNVLLLHWQNINTKTPKYKIEVRIINSNGKVKLLGLYKIWYNFTFFLEEVFGKIKRKIFSKIKYK